MIYSIDTNVNTTRIITEAKFEPSTRTPDSLKKVVISICNSILNKSKNLDKKDKKVAAALNTIEGSITLAKDTSYTDNAYPIEIKSSITGDISCMEYAVSALKSAGFKHANMKDGKKAQTWYKKSGNDILVATVVGTIIGKSIVTIIMHAVTNNEHNMDIINGISESAIFESVELI